MVQDVGRIQRDRILTVKSIEYTIASLLPLVDTHPFENGYFGIFFLSPSDCHRVCSPQDGHIEEVIHVPGYRLLVHPPYQEKEYPVFALNERVILRLSTPLGACIMVLVAGWGVGHITLPLDRAFRPRARKPVRKKYLSPIRVRRGEWVATFELGSTVILITEPILAAPDPHYSGQQGPIWAAGFFVTSTRCPNGRSIGNRNADDSMTELLLVAGSKNPVLADFVTHACQHGKRRLAVISTPDVCRRVRRARGNLLNSRLLHSSLPGGSRR